MAAANRPAKTALIVAQRIVSDVIAQGLQPGAALPSEKIMLETYHIGRGTLREALRLLEFQGVITIKPGPGGGPMFMRPDAGHLASTLVLLMQLANAPFRVSVETRYGIEPVISRLAATRISDEQLAELGESVEEMSLHISDERIFLDSNKKFHDIIAWSSGNPLFGYLVDSLLGILDGTRLGIDYPEHRRKAILKAHEDIFSALSSHDADAAEQQMQRHVKAYVDYATKRYPDLMDQVIAWDTSLR
jgi:DNA-binding FadR family transcriptional regulator